MKAKAKYRTVEYGQLQRGEMFYGMGNHRSRGPHKFVKVQILGGGGYGALHVKSYLIYRHFTQTELVWVRVK